MAEYTIAAEPRTVKGKNVKRLRNEGVIPGSVYGPNIEPMVLQFPGRELENTLRKAGGTNLIDITVEKETYPTLAREVQRDVLKKNILHVDFFAVDMNTKISANVPIILIGQSPVVAGRQGILLTGPNVVTIEVLPRNLINRVEIDLSVLEELGDEITVGDLELGEISILNEPGEMLAKVVQTSAARSEELDAMEAEGEEVIEDDGAEPEVIARGSVEEEDEE